MKLKIFLFWLASTLFAPFLLQIPVVGNWIVAATVIGPMVLGVLAVIFSDIFSDHSGYASRGLGSSSDVAEAQRNRAEALARSDWRFDHGRMYHSRDHWD